MTFLCSYLGLFLLVASQAITRSIKQQCLKPWATWGAIPSENKDHFWQRFKITHHQTYSLCLIVYVKSQMQFHSIAIIL